MYETDDKAISMCIIMHTTQQIMYTLQCGMEGEEYCCSLQVPSLLDWVSTFYRCSSGVKYTLLVVVPSFYIFSSLLFVLLGIVTVRWERRVGKYSVLDNSPNSNNTHN